MREIVVVFAYISAVLAWSYDKKSIFFVYKAHSSAKICTHYEYKEKVNNGFDFMFF